MAATVAPRSATRTIVVAGLLGAFGDFVFALTYYGPHLAVFQNVAAGVLGIEASRAGGTATFLLGVALHFFIGVIWATVLWVLSREWPIIVRRPVLAGLAYGIVIFYGMYQVVLPLSALRTSPWPMRWLPVDLIAHMVLVGLPMSLAMSRAGKSRVAA